MYLFDVCDWNIIQCICLMYVTGTLPSVYVFDVYDWNIIQCVFV